MGPTILVSGGAGYTGSMLVMALLNKGYRVKVVDLMIYGREILPKHPLLEVYKMDIRDSKLVSLLFDVDVVFHLAGVSNDPGEGLEPEIGYQINVEAVESLVNMCNDMGVKKLFYPSSCSVYGNATEKIVTEESIVHPLTIYAECKARCEEIILKNRSNSLCCTILRPATVCGVSLRQRFDLLVNSIVKEAYFKHEINVSGPYRIRPGVNILDLVDLYLKLIELPAHQINGQIFNVAFENQKIRDIACSIATLVGEDVDINIIKGEDKRSYQVSSKKLQKIIGFHPKKTTKDAVTDLLYAMTKGKFDDALTSSQYYNRKRQPLYLTKY
ncbi:NAD-dependent epimerase/dehydratase family protein [Siminovitchia sediminis]|uniref:NAD-dependent epimerase/dehydratase family protein n=1 Tax=Siminovitchia sediminis TaxID=1274353 RepID=A0ABW4KMF6_9BACI